MSEQYIGQIEAFAFGIVPRGWAICAGQLLSIQQNQALFSLLGTQFGGNGVQTFGLPDLRGRAATGYGLSYQMGTKAGEENHTLLSTEVPAHTHSLVVNNNGTSGGTAIPTSALVPGSPYDAASGTATSLYAASTTTPTVALSATSAAGGGQAHSNMMPYLALNYCIALTGLFPSRN